MPAQHTVGTRRIAVADSALRGGAIAVAGFGALLLATALTGLPSPFAAAATLSVYATIAAILLLTLAANRMTGPFGPANAITLGRAALIALIAGFAADPPALEATSWWLAAGLATTAWLLDGLDGMVARRRNCASAFGARFDMEVDAVFALVLVTLLWRADKAGAWVLALGGLRYAFVLAGMIYAPMRQPLPPRERRRLICGLQGAALCLALLPVLPPAFAAAICGAALLATTVSFALDAAWLLRARTRAN